MANIPSGLGSLDAVLDWFAQDQRAKYGVTSGNTYQPTVNANSSNSRYVPLGTYSALGNKISNETPLIDNIVNRNSYESNNEIPNPNEYSGNNDTYEVSVSNNSNLKIGVLTTNTSQQTTTQPSEETSKISQLANEQIIQGGITSATEIADVLSDQKSSASVYETINAASPSTQKTSSGYIPRGEVITNLVMDVELENDILKEQLLKSDDLYKQLIEEWARIGRVKDTYLDPDVKAQYGVEESNVGDVKPLHHFRGHVYNQPGKGQYEYGKQFEFNYGTKYAMEHNGEEYVYKYLQVDSDAVRDPNIGIEGSYYAIIDDHFIYDNNDVDKHPLAAVQSDGKKKMAGSASPVYADNEVYTRRIYERGMYEVDKTRYGAREISPLGPFFNTPGQDANSPTLSMNGPEMARYANLFSYNRTRIPIATLEWRKGFRYIFITRPECYIMAKDNSTHEYCLSQQCDSDADFKTSFARMPHICQLLSPSYFIKGVVDGDNFNYLLSNRVQGLSPSGTNLEQVQSMQKSTFGATILPGSTISTDYGNTISLTFTDTRYLEVYELLRLWMRYINNIYVGTFAPYYGGVRSGSLTPQKENHYGLANTSASASSARYLPYDRALDYCATIFDIVTNEAGSKILYWCKYIGVYPVSAEPGSLANSSNEALTSEQKVNASFYYQGKVESNFRTFTEFNFNAGLLDECGNLNSKDIEFSLPYLLRKDYPIEPYGGNSNGTFRNTNYMGTAGLFTGRPYIVLANEEGKSIGEKSVTRTVPYLRFIQLEDKFANVMNGGFVNNTSDALNPYNETVS
jgi:hypothetical protein